jgi:hypothetical protein
MVTLDFSNNSCKYFSDETPHYYAVCHDTEKGWYLTRYNTFWDHMHAWGAQGEIVSEYYQDPEKFLAETEIGGKNLRTILQNLPAINQTPDSVEYNFEKFIADISHKIEYLFLFKGRRYFIDYWGPDEELQTWVPGWIFIADNGTVPQVNEKNFETFVRLVDNWMIKTNGLSLKEMFDCYYNPDNTGELRLVMIDWCRFDFEREGK